MSRLSLNAVKFTGFNYKEINDFVTKVDGYCITTPDTGDAHLYINITSPTGHLQLLKNDYLCKSELGELYTCRDFIFELQDMIE